MNYLLNGITIFQVYLLPLTVSPVAKKTCVGLPSPISTCGRSVEFIFFISPFHIMLREIAIEFFGTRHRRSSSETA